MIALFITLSLAGNINTTKKRETTASNVMSGLERNHQRRPIVHSAGARLNVASLLAPVSEVEYGSFPPSRACSRRTPPATDKTRLRPKSTRRVGQCRTLVSTRQPASRSVRRGSLSTTSTTNSIWNLCRGDLIIRLLLTFH